MARVSESEFQSESLPQSNAVFSQKHGTVLSPLLTTLLSDIYGRYPGESESPRYRSNNGLPAEVYGEVSSGMSGVGALIGYALGMICDENDNPQSDTGHVFIDLGCGTGRLVVEAYLNHRIDKSIGVELGPRRYAAAVGAKDEIVRTLGKEG